MHGLYREERHKGSAPISQDLARHLYIRMLCGKVAIVTEEPAKLLPALRKEWLKLERKLRRERSSTMNAARILELTQQIAYMQSCKFTAKAPIDEPTGQVQLATIEQFLEWPPQCRTMYVTCPVELEQLHMVTSWMSVHSLVVMYKE